MIRVLIVDDHATFRQPLAFMLEREADITVAGQAGTLEEARPQLTGVDIAVVDLDLPDGNGLDLFPELRQANPQGRALVLTGATRSREQAAAVQAGADGLMCKSARIKEVIEAIRRLGRGEEIMPLAQVVELLRQAARQREQDRAAELAIERLTPREVEVLRELARGMSDKEIAEQLHIGTETVRTHMVNIFGKLGVESRLQALVFAVRHGVVEIS